MGKKLLNYDEHELCYWADSHIFYPDSVQTYKHNKLAIENRHPKKYTVFEILFLVNYSSQLF